MDLQFEKATITDIPALLQLCQAVSKTPGTSWSSDYPNKNVLSQDISADTLYRIMSGGTLIGMISIGEDPVLSELPWEESGGKICGLSRFCIAPAYQGQGLGALAVCQALRLSQSMGFDTVRILVVSDYIHAQKLYQKQGFSILGPVSLWDMNFLCMQKKLG